jgi:pilus assembly protein CpaC
MHRTAFLSRPGVWAVLLAAWVFGPFLVQPVHAQPEQPTTKVYLPINGTELVQMSKYQLIQEFKSEDPRIARVERAPGADSLRKVAVLAGNTPGTTLVTLTDEAKNVERFQIIVETYVEQLRRVLRNVFPTANLTVTPAGNNIILSGTVARATDLEAIVRTAASITGDPTRVINAMTVGGVMQVQLDVVVARVARTKARTMGFSFLESGNQQFLASTVGGPGSLVSSITGLSGGAGPNSTLTASPNIVFGVLTGAFGFHGYLTALESESLVKLMAQPKLIALSGQPADFIDGGEQAVPDLASGSAGGGAVAGVRFVPFGTTVRFLPIVLGGGKIYLEVEPQFTAPDPTALFAAPIPGTTTTVAGRTTQRVHTSVVMEDGQTFAIGGMIFHQVTASASRVPVLGEIPFLATLFSNVSYTDAEEELIVLVTPHLVDAMSCDQMPKFLPGEETRNPDDFELFLERILEAPRGHRDVCVDGRYVPAYKSGPTANMYPCPNCNGPRGACDFTIPAGPTCIGGPGCQNGACGNKGCSDVWTPNGATVPPGQPVNQPTVPAVQPMPPAQGPTSLPERAQYQGPIDSLPPVPAMASPLNPALPVEPPVASTPAALLTPIGGQQ